LVGQFRRQRVRYDSGVRPQRQCRHPTSTAPERRYHRLTPRSAKPVRAAGRPPAVAPCTKIAR